MNRVVVSLFALLLAAPLPVLPQSAQSVAIAVAGSGNTTSSSVAAQLGRSPYFLLYDAKGNFLSAESNPYKDSGQAGIPAVDFLAAKGVKVVVAEGFGGRIADVMKEKGIQPVEFKGVAKDAAKKAAQVK